MTSVNCQIEIKAPREAVFQLVSDIPRSAGVISAIESVEVLSDPEVKVGFRWKETRKMFGKLATETMEITDFVPHSHYVTRAENHGMVYQTEVRVEALGSQATRLLMTFNGEAQTLFARVMSALMGKFMAGAVAKALQVDLIDVKRAG